MSANEKFGKHYRTFHRFWMFFFILGFVLTCCMVLFLKTLTKTMGIEFTSENVEAAAKITFLNVTFLTVILTVLDAIRLQLTVEFPVKKIIDAAEKMMQGDFSVRINLKEEGYEEERFREIATYFNKMAEELSGIETLRTDFISNVSHELKTPLAVIQNYGTMLQSNHLSEEERVEYAKAITEASRKLANLITNILKLNKLENQQIVPKTEVYDLGEQVCECLLVYENVWEDKEIVIETEIESDVLVKSDSEMLALVWNNLFSNAFKFTRRGGTVSVCVKQDGDWAIVTVSDTGCGISHEVGAHIFDKFYQGDTSHATQGNGIGLALVKRVIDITGSEIGVESKVGVGSVFTVKIRRG